jgi:hypothetical protein
MKGYDTKWRDWTRHFDERGSIGIRVNDDIGHYFQSKKDSIKAILYQPILLNIIVHMLAILIAREKEDGQVAGIIPHLVDGRILILQYADDTIIFMEYDLEKSLNIKLVLLYF